ncbi:MAG: N-acetylmuramoyl-L-alanine amidase, partial [Candidatus Eremiobacteraeota bacterium]|nr:N-acetylmuramoyl-L-alanine amidase [Candidatus Eremiobacteraeota bacterium]
MLKRVSVLIVLLLTVATLTPSLAQEEPDSPKCELRDRSERELRFLGHKLRIQGRATSLDEEFMVRADVPELQAVAQAFGKTLQWSSATTTLTSSNGVTLALNQSHLPAGDEGRQLPMAPQLLDGSIHIPLSALEELLDVRLTFREQTVYVEPVIRSVKVEGSGKSAKLIIDSTAPVSFKSFRLREPDRFVIDVAGAVLDTPRMTVDHPEMGDIRLGQFELGPAISRIVVPTSNGVVVSGQTQGKASAIAYNLKLPQASAPAQNFQCATISDVRLDTINNGVRFEMSANAPIQYEWSRLLPPDNRFFMDIPNAMLPDKKKAFEINDPYLGSVRVSQFQPQPKPVVRVVMDLKRPANMRFLSGKGENNLAIEVLHQEINPRYAVLKGYGTTSFPAAGGVICIDPGHGGSDPGAINRSIGLSEKEVTLDICNRLARILKGQGWNVVLTRSDDRDVSWSGSSAKQELGARAQVANDLKADLFVSVHCNASTNPSVNGTSLHYYKQGDLVLAQSLQGSVVA